jgi:hypothetical protein
MRRRSFAVEPPDVQQNRHQEDECRLGHPPRYDIIASGQSGGHLAVQVKAINGFNWQFDIRKYVDAHMHEDGEHQVPGGAATGAISGPDVRSGAAQRDGERPLLGALLEGASGCFGTRLRGVSFEVWRQKTKETGFLPHCARKHGYRLI